MERTYNYKKGIIAMLICFTIWGFQPLYWSLCSVFSTSFLLAIRILLAGIFCFILISIQGKTKEVFIIIRDWKLLFKEIAASFFLLLDWAIFLFAVQSGRVLETSLAYYIEPIIVFLAGAIVYKEHLDFQHYIVLVFLLFGIVCAVWGFNGVPLVAITLPFFFSIYAIIKKSLDIDSFVSTTFEIVVMMPLAFIYLLFISFNDYFSFEGVNFWQILALLGSGIITGLPMLFYSIENYNLPLTVCGISQYISPTLGIVCSIIMGEELTNKKLVSFAFIWIGVIIFTIHTIQSVVHDRHYDLISY